MKHSPKDPKRAREMECGACSIEIFEALVWFLSWRGQGFILPYGQVLSYLATHEKRTSREIHILSHTISFRIFVNLRPWRILQIPALHCWDRIPGISLGDSRRTGVVQPNVRSACGRPVSQVLVHLKNGKRIYYWRSNTPCVINSHIKDVIVVESFLSSRQERARSLLISA